MTSKMTEGQAAKAKLTRRAVERARKISERRRENLIEQMSRFEVLDVREWLPKSGAGAAVYDTGPDLANADHGDEGSVVVIGPGGSMLIGYVWDTDAGVRRWTSVRRMDLEVQS